MKAFVRKRAPRLYVSGHPLDAYVDLFAAKNYRSIASLGELDDRALFKIAGAIVEVERKFTRREGKPFAVVWLEDLTDMLEVVVWNEVYMKISDALVTGRVVEIKGTLDKRDDALRGTAQEIKTLAPEKTNGANERSINALQESAVLLQFSPQQRGMNCAKCARFFPVHRADARFGCCLIAQTAIRYAWTQAWSFASTLRAISRQSCHAGL